MSSELIVADLRKADFDDLWFLAHLIGRRVNFWRRLATSVQQMFLNSTCLR